MSKSREFAQPLETVLWDLLRSSIPIEQKKPVYDCLSSIFNTEKSFTKLYDAWRGQRIANFQLSETESTQLAYELILRKPEHFHAISSSQLERIDNPDRKAQFLYTLRALSPNADERTVFFEELQFAANRKPEPWVTEALHWLHHPLRTQYSVMFIEPSLDLLTEVQATGDIFFPKMWLDATLWGHTSAEANHIVEQWLRKHPHLSPNLRQKVMQSAHLLKQVEKE